MSAFKGFSFTMLKTYKFSVVKWNAYLCAALSSLFKRLGDSQIVWSVALDCRQIRFHHVQLNIASPPSQRMTKTALISLKIVINARSAPIIFFRSIVSPLCQSFSLVNICGIKEDAYLLSTTFHRVLFKSEAKITFQRRSSCQPKCIAQFIIDMR